MVSRSYPAADTERWSACSPFMLQGEDPVPSPQEQIEAVGLARCHSSSTKTYTSSLFAGKRYLQTSALPNTGYESSLPSRKEMLLVMFQVPGTLLCNSAKPVCHHYRSLYVTKAHEPQSLYPREATVMSTPCTATEQPLLAELEKACAKYQNSQCSQKLIIFLKGLVHLNNNNKTITRQWMTDFSTYLLSDPLPKFAHLWINVMCISTQQRP